MDNTTVTEKLKASQHKSNQILEKIIADKEYHNVDLLQSVIDAIDELIQLVEEKRNR